MLYTMNQHTKFSGSLHSLHVLLVDDDDFMLESIGDMLHDLGVANITTAKDGKQGFAAFEGARLAPDIIICDLNMPNTDGFQMMELLAKKSPNCGFILMSGLEQRFVNSAALMGRFHHLNILGALSKPIDKRTLGELISKWRQPVP